MCRIAVKCSPNSCFSTQAISGFLHEQTPVSETTWRERPGRASTKSGLCPQTSRGSTRARRTPRQPLPPAENNVPAVPVGSGIFLETVYRLTPRDRGSGRRRHQHPHRQAPGAPQLAVFQRRLCPLSARHPSSPNFHCTARPAPGPTALCMDRLSPPMTACRKPYFWKLQREAHTARVPCRTGCEPLNLC